MSGGMGSGGMGSGGMGSDGMSIFFIYTLLI